MKIHVEFAGNLTDVPGMDEHYCIEVDTPEQLFEIVKEIGQSLIIERWRDEPTVTVYNGWLE